MPFEKERLSAVIIACNERERLPRLFQTISFADEIVVVDSGSTDGTVEWVLQNGGRVIETSWLGYVEQKNRALEEARFPWVLSLDCDEWLSEELAQSIQKVLQDPQAVGYEMQRCNYWIEKPLYYGTFGRNTSLRLFKKGFGKWEGIEPHDHYCCDGKVLSLQGLLHHQPYRSWQEHIEHIDSYTSIAADDLHKNGTVVYIWDVLLRPIWHIIVSIVFRFAWLDGPRGILVAFLGGYYVLLKWGKLLWKQQRSL